MYIVNISYSLVGTTLEMYVCLFVCVCVGGGGARSVVVVEEEELVVIVVVVVVVECVVK